MKKIIALASVTVLLSLSAARAENPEDLIRKGKVFGEVRYRYEKVDQANLARTGIASTVRADLGFETGVYYDFKALVDLQTVRHIGDDHFNDTVNGKGTYPTIADPENSEFNQLWVSWAGIPQTTVKIGRQIINLDNQRFIGSVNWRQNDQTFDAGMASFSPVKDMNLGYYYLWDVNRINGKSNAIPQYDGDSHLFHADYKFADWLKAAGYGYLIDIDQTKTLSSQTFGAQLTGTHPIDDQWKFQYLAEYAHQSDYKDNPHNYSAAYFHLSPSVLWKNITLQAGFESLAGDGTDAFQTPLATLHAFNGWADKFLTTPANGLEDAYGRFSYKVSDVNQYVDGTVFDAVYHDYRAEKTSADYGSEWDLQLSKSFKTEGFVLKDWTVTAKYADYNAGTILTDTNKLWFMVDAKF